jgi:hypothetical protein
MPDKHILPAGTYYITDPCYLIDNDKWSDFLDKVMYPNGAYKRDNNDEYVINNYMGVTACIFNTAYGDGSYQLKINSSDNIFSSINNYNNKEIGVDSGLIGLIRVSDYWKEDLYLFKNGMMQITFKNDIECYISDGVMHFGDIIIDTKCDDEDNEEDNDFDDEVWK